jgi:hypothetical protein
MTAFCTGAMLLANGRLSSYSPDTVCGVRCSHD